MYKVIIQFLRVITPANSFFQYDKMYIGNQQRHALAHLTNNPHPLELILIRQVITSCSLFCLSCLYSILCSQMLCSLSTHSCFSFNISLTNFFRHFPFFTTWTTETPMKHRYVPQHKSLLFILTSWIYFCIYNESFAITECKSQQILYLIGNMRTQPPKQAS